MQAQPFGDAVARRARPSFFAAKGQLHDPEDRLISEVLVPGQPQPVSLAGASARSHISAAATDYFSSEAPQGLFRPGPTDPAAQEELLSALERRLDPKRQAEAEGPAGDGSVSLQCLTAALACTAGGKMPGSDGLTYEFYKATWSVMGPILQSVVDHVMTAFEVSGEDPTALPQSWRQGVIALNFKGSRSKPLPRAAP